MGWEQDDSCISASPWRACPHLPLQLAAPGSCAQSGPPGPARREGQLLGCTPAGRCRGCGCCCRQHYYCYQRSGLLPVPPPPLEQEAEPLAWGSMAAPAAAHTQQVNRIGCLQVRCSKSAVVHTGRATTGCSCRRYDTGATVLQLAHSSQSSSVTPTSQPAVVFLRKSVITAGKQRYLPASLLGRSEKAPGCCCRLPEKAL